VFNIGNPIETPIIELAERIVERTASASTIAFVPFSEVYPVGFEEIMRRVPDISKAQRFLDFAPRITLDDTLDTVIAGFRAPEVLV
jgi:UDP-glucose 4-epimerase